MLYYSKWLSKVYADIGWPSQGYNSPGRSLDLPFQVADFVIHLSFTWWLPLMPRAAQTSEQCEIRTASLVWEREAIYSFTPACIPQAGWRWGRDDYYFLNVKFLPSFSSPPNFLLLFLSSSFPPFLPPSLSLDFSSLSLSSSLSSSFWPFLLALKLYSALGESTYQC